MKEIVYNIEEFKAKVDKTKPLHHCAMRKSLDQNGLFYRIVFRIHGIDKNDGHVVIFETQKRTTIAELEEHMQEYKKLAEKYAKPLGSTEGAWTQ